MNRIGLLLTKIQNKFKDYCEFQNICPYFDPNQFTCANKGGSHCGRYRRFKAQQTVKEHPEPNTGI